MRTIKRDIVGAFIFSADGKLLLGKSVPGGVFKDMWIVPGGGIEPDETKLQALVREVQEETGIDITGAQIDFIGESNGQSPKTLRDTNEQVLVDMTFYDYKIVLSQSAADVALVHDDDFMDAQWFAPSHIATMALSPTTLKTIQKIVAA